MDLSNAHNDDLHRLLAVCKWLARSYRATGQRGFSIGFELRRGWLASFSETTGYIIPTCYRFAKLYHQPKYSEMASQAAHWLVSIQSPEGWFPEYTGRRNKPRLRPPVVFNTGQDLFGLLSAYRITGDSTFLESAYRAGLWIAKQQSADGLWHNPGFVAGESASYYTHVSWPMQILANEVGDIRLATCAQRGLDAIIARFRSNNTIAFWGFSPQQPAFLHTIAYTIEGLLEQGLLLGPNTKPVQIARSIALMLLGLLEKYNCLAGTYDDNWHGDFSYVCTPGNCQIALIFMRLYLLNSDERFLAGAASALNPIMSAQWNSQWVPGPVRGTIPASWPPVFGKYMRWLYPNWAAKYLADALIYRLYLQKISSGHDDYSLPRLLEQIPG
jgi:hypothetical protein